MIYIKDSKGRLKTLKELANEFGLPLQLVSGRYRKGERDFHKLTEPKYQSAMK